MILQSLKNHPTTARMLRPETTRNCTLLAMATVLLLLPASTLVAQPPSPTPANPHGQTSNTIYQTYHQQLLENQRRALGSDAAYQQQLQRNQAAQTYLPPVHVAPQLPPRSSRPNQSLNGRFNSVQDFAVPHKPAYESLSDSQRNANRQPARVPTIASRPRPQRAATSIDNRSVEPAPTEHVFLQDRIANALAKHLGRKPKHSPVVRERSSTAPEHFNVAPPRVDVPVYQEQYAAREVQHQYNSPQYAVESQDNLPSSSVLQQSPWDQLERETKERRQADLQLASIESNGDRIKDNLDDDDSRVVPSSYQVQRDGSKSRNRLAKRKRGVRAPRPIRPTKNSLRASQVSVLVSQEREESLEDLDFDLPLDREDTQDSLSDDLQDLDDEDFSSPLRPKAEEDDEDGPDQRDDLESIDEDDEDDDESRIRSRLNDDLDDLDDLDDIDRDDIDDEPETNRPTDRPCNDFRDELLSTSIRDIALDISPPAYSEASRYGGPSRQWADRSGNVIANGTMVDLRRGYVILDSGQKIPYSKLSVTDLAAVSEFWRLPTVCLLGNRGGSPYRRWAQQTVTWKASSLCHKPLYFENRQLERYGHSRGPFAQPVHSTVHFFVSLVSLPYQTAINPPNECQYALGFYRPGNCAPWLKDPVPISLEGASRQALFTTGAAFIP